MAEVRRSLVYSAARSYAGVAVQLISTVVLSRLLTPAEVGVFVVATVFAALATNFRDFGIAEYLIQAKDPSRDTIRAALAVNILTSWSMGVLMWLLAGPVGEFYRADGVTDVMRVQAFNFLLMPFGAINMAWHRRAMNFRPLFICGIASDLLALSVSITLAWRGFGAMSMAWASLASTVATVLVSMAFRPAGFPWLPGRRGLGEVLRFGSLASGIYVLAQLGRSAPELVIGRVLGVTDVALFSRGAGVIQLFRQLVLRAVTPVCLPYFAESVRTEGSVNRAYARGITIFTGVGWVFLGFLALAAFPSIRLIYGDQWTAAVPLAQVLCAAAAVELVHHLSRDALLAHGQVALATRLQVTLQAAQLAGLAAVVPFGLMGACWGLLAASFLSLALSQWHLRTATRLSLGEVWRACRPSATVTLLGLLPMVALALAMPATEANFVRHLLLGAALTGAAWLLSLRFTGHPLWAELLRAAAPLRRRLARSPRPPQA
jgi:O-antigen/teichoic acid export membrane protein